MITVKFGPCFLTIYNQSESLVIVQENNPGGIAVDCFPKDGMAVIGAGTTARIKAANYQWPVFAMLIQGSAGGLACPA